jgi:hypothetical protein
VLIGMRKGETIAWNGLGGRQNGVTVLKVLYQPKVKGRCQSPFLASLT